MTPDQLQGLQVLWDIAKTLGTGGLFAIFWYMADQERRKVLADTQARIDKLTADAQARHDRLVEKVEAMGQRTAVAIEKVEAILNAAARHSQPGGGGG